jgi:hypothetical protein
MKMSYEDDAMINMKMARRINPIPDCPIRNMKIEEIRTRQVITFLFISTFYHFFSNIHLSQIKIYRLG